MTRSEPHGHTVQKPRTALFYSPCWRIHVRSPQQPSRQPAIVRQTAFSCAITRFIADRRSGSAFRRLPRRAVALHERAGSWQDARIHAAGAGRRSASRSRPSRARRRLRRLRGNVGLLSTGASSADGRRVPVPCKRLFQLFASLRVFQVHARPVSASVYAPRHAVRRPAPSRRDPPQAAFRPPASSDLDPRRKPSSHASLQRVSARFKQPFGSLLRRAFASTRFRRAGRPVPARGRLARRVAHRSGPGPAAQQLGRTDPLPRPNTRRSARPSGARGRRTCPTSHLAGGASLPLS